MHGSYYYHDSNKEHVELQIDGSPDALRPSATCFIVNGSHLTHMTDHSQHSGSPSAFESKVKTDSPRFERNQKAMAEMVAQRSQ